MPASSKAMYGTIRDSPHFENFKNKVTLTQEKSEVSTFRLLVFLKSKNYAVILLRAMPASAESLP
jgi:hypothetical protein